MAETKCFNCEYWQRDGGDGICRCDHPKPAIVENGKSYVVVWPKTNANDWCSRFKSFAPSELAQ